ncbi:MAG: hypothetical protein G01um101466_543 [Parcubacteria group bacterium Gr01-1014_66]|nr:MAG: hypothetical protein G01um101466_543 [Parcubacteria group bacterium Gr01-1014_66]
MKYTNRENRMIVSTDYLRETSQQVRQRRCLIAVSVAGGVLTVGFYFLYQLRDWIMLPQLSIERPADGMTLQGPEIIVEGMVTPGVLAES